MNNVQDTATMSNHISATVTNDLHNTIMDAIMAMNNPVPEDSPEEPVQQAITQSLILKLMW